MLTNNVQVDINMLKLPYLAKLTANIKPAIQAFFLIYRSDTWLQFDYRLSHVQSLNTLQPEELVNMVKKIY